MKKNDLNKQEYMDFLQSCKYAIVAMQNETHEALHVVLYAEFPREIDFNNLAEELKIDEELGFVGRDDYQLVILPDNIFKEYHRMLMEELNE